MSAKFLGLVSDIPPRRNGATEGPNARKSMIEDMQIGEWIFFRPEEIKGFKSARVSASVYGKALGRKYTSRTMEDGFRIWRLS